jgi:hypothetical protein
MFIRASMLSSGALAIHPSWFPGPGQYAFPSLGGSRNGGPGGLAGWARCWVLRERAFVPGLRCGPGSRFPWMGGPGSGCRPFLENCTVDASISCFCDMEQC